MAQQFAPEQASAKQRAKQGQNKGKARAMETIPFPGLAAELLWTWCADDKSLCIVSDGEVFLDPCVVLPRMLPGLDPECVWQTINNMFTVDPNARPLLCGTADVLKILLAIDRCGLLEASWHCAYARSQIVAQLRGGKKRPSFNPPKGMRQSHPVELELLWEACQRGSLPKLWAEMERWPTYAHGSVDELVNDVFGGSVPMALASIIGGDTTTPEYVHKTLCDLGIEDPENPRSFKVIMANIQANQQSKRLAKRINISRPMITYMSASPKNKDAERACQALCAFKGCVRMAAERARAEDGVWAQHHLHNAFTHAINFRKLCTPKAPKSHKKKKHFTS